MKICRPARQPFAFVIQGGDEREKGEVEIKDLVAGARASAEITDNTEWRESRPAQFSVKEEDLVESRARRDRCARQRSGRRDE